jgi:diguanylate cyclase (GGDEF)-like protein/PAS domain S-box-containing protein
MSQRPLLGKLLIAPALVLLVLVAVAAGQIITSRDLLQNVRGLDNLQLALHTNSETIARAQEAAEAFRRFQAGLLGKEPEKRLNDLRTGLAQESDRLSSIAREMFIHQDFAEAVMTDKELLVNYASLLKQIAENPSPAILFADQERMRELILQRLMQRDQALHVALSDLATTARAEAEAAIPTAILLSMIGVMAALAGSLVAARWMSTSLKRLADAMHRLARGEAGIGEAAAGLGREFTEISEALELFRRAALEKRAVLAALAENEDSLKRVLDAAPVPLAMTRPSEGRLVYANRHCRELFRFEGPTENIEVKQFYANPADRDRFVEQVRRHGELHDFEVTMRRADGIDRLMLVSAVPLSYRGESVIVLGYSDVTDYRDMLSKLQESEEKLRLIVETTPVPLVLTRVGDDKLIYVNKLTLELFHIPPEMNVIGLPASDFWADPAGREKMKAALAEGKGYMANVEARLKRPNGTWFWAQLSAASTEFKGEPVLLVSVEDITRRKELEDDLRRHATTDFLTSIANRRHLIDNAEREFARARRYDHPLSVLMLDIDRFKRINDTFGHPVGDEVVKAMAQLCKEALREIDHLGRMGGEEFAILLPETVGEEAARVAERIRQAVEAFVVDIDGLTPGISFTVSIGVACLILKDQGFDQMLMRADRALYKAKQAGRNCVKMAEE